MRNRTRVVLGLVSFGTLALSGCTSPAPAPPVAPPPVAAPAPAPPAAGAPAAGAPFQPFQGQGQFQDQGQGQSQGYGGTFRSPAEVEASLGRRSQQGGYWPVSVQLGQSAQGNILYDGWGFALYQYTNDSTQPPASHCSGACAAQFHPVLVNAQISFQNVDPSHIGTYLRSDGTQQLTYYSHPLYRYSSDFVPGQAAAYGLDNSWYTIGYDGQIPGSH